MTMFRLVTKRALGMPLLPIGVLQTYDQHYNQKKRAIPDMLIKVRTLTGKEIELDVEPGYKVSQIKEKVEEKEGIPPAQQRLIYGGKQMNDDKTATEYSLEAGATLHLVLALRGGAVENGSVVVDIHVRYEKLDPPKSKVHKSNLSPADEARLDEMTSSPYTFRELVYYNGVIYP